MKRSRESFLRLCGASELSVATLTSGQAFRWIPENEEKSKWASPLGNTLFRLQWHDEEVQFDFVPRLMSEEQARQKLRNYFRLDADMSALIEEWKRRDPLFGPSQENVGLRLLRQDPYECLLSFICSQNNNVKRISQMINTFCSSFGTVIEGGFFSFPQPNQLASVTESKLRELGFGYRAPYILDCVNRISQSPSWLEELKGQSAEHCREELTKIKGVGLKVADCVALFSLDQVSIVPVDTHVWQIAKEKYKLKGTEDNKSLTPKVYKHVSQQLSDIWGPYAGWAHSLEFNTKLKAKRVPKAKKKAK